MEQTLGKRIVQHRKRLGLTQDQLAEKLGVTAQAVSKWENDQSCPDITMLPRLAAIFGTTTDALLGNEPVQPVHEAEVVVENEADQSHNHFEFSWNAGRKSALSTALLILVVGVQLILSKLLHYDISFWNVLWPSALLIFGVFGVLPKFSFVSLGCALFGAYFILNCWQLLPFTLGGELVFPAILVVFGLSLLVDAFKKPRKPRVSVKHNGLHHRKHKDDYQLNTDGFELDACFGESTKLVSLPILRYGDISASFGDYTVDLSAVGTVADRCTIDATCSFGALTILVPSRFEVTLDTTTAFGDVNINGHHNPETDGTILIDASANFGEISIRYI